MFVTRYKGGSGYTRSIAKDEAHWLRSVPTWKILPIAMI